MAEGDYFVNGIKVRSDGAVYTTTTANMADLANTSDAAKGDALLGVKLSATGAVATAQHARNNLVLYLEDFGAVGDGVTDDAAAWVLAIAGIGSANATLNGSPGKTYLIGAAGISIANKTSVCVVGNGAKIKVNAVATQAPSGLGSTVIFLDTNTNTEFSGWEIDGNSKASNLIGLKGNTECTVRDNRMSSGGLSGQVFANGNSRCKYIDNECISGTGAARGMWLGNYAASQMEIDPEVAGNVCRSMGATGIVLAAEGGRCYGNHVEDCAGSGIIWGGVSGFISKNLTIYGNVCRGNAFHGLQADSFVDAGSGQFINLLGNICEENDGAGIFLAYALDVVVSGNICRDNNFDGTASGYGILVDVYAKRIVITGNHCVDTRTGGSRTQTDGIQINSAVAAAAIEDIAVTGNICVNNTTSGIRVTNSGSGTILGVSLVGNVTNNNGGVGLTVTDAVTGDISEITVVGNTSTGNTSADVRIDPPDAVISGNRFGASASTLVHSFTSTDATPSVKGRNAFKTANASATTITALDDGVEGQQVTVLINDANTTIDFTGTTLKGNAGGDWSPGSGDHMVCTKIGSNWYCQISDNTA